MRHPELELEAELESLMSVLAESDLEAEAERSPNVPSGVLAFQLPDAPYSDGAIKLLEKSVDVIEAAHTATSVFGSVIEGMVGAVALEGIMAVLAALAAIIAPILPAAAGLSEGRADSSRNGVRDGFPIGVVTGANASPWANAKRMFGKTNGDINSYYNAFDPGAGIEYLRGFNAGLVTGWAQGQEITKYPARKSFFWQSLYKAMPSDAKSVISRWNSIPEDQKDTVRKDFYYAAANAFRRIYVRN